jgi:hypothetical protein
LLGIVLKFGTSELGKQHTNLKNENGLLCRGGIFDKNLEDVNRPVRNNSTDGLKFASVAPKGSKVFSTSAAQAPSSLAMTSTPS